MGWYEVGYCPPYSSSLFSKYVCVPFTPFLLSLPLYLQVSIPFCLSLSPFLSATVYVPFLSPIHKCVFRPSYRLFLFLFICKSVCGYPFIPLLSFTLFIHKFECVCVCMSSFPLLPPKTLLFELSLKILPLPPPKHAVHGSNSQTHCAQAHLFRQGFWGSVGHFQG